MPLRQVLTLKMRRLLRRQVSVSWNREELGSCYGHEVSHIRNYDIRISTIAVVALASAITMLSSMAGRMMWWGGAGRRRSDDDRDGNGLEIIMLVVSLLAIVAGTSRCNLGATSYFSSEGIP